MTLGFIGYGVVGQATALLAKEAGHEIRVCDPPLGHNDKLDNCDAAFVSVPVPTLPSGKQDTTLLRTAIWQAEPTTPVYIRSTVLPRTCESMRQIFQRDNIFSFPEFLTQRFAESDIKTLSFLCSLRGSELLHRIFPLNDSIQMDGETECELVKYAHNAGCAINVGFWNLIYAAADQLGLDYSLIREATCDITGFLTPKHGKVPGPDGKFGFGGKCLPKDLLAFATELESLLGRKTFLREVLSDNFTNRFGGLF